MTGTGPAIAALEEEDRKARWLAQTEFRRPLVLEAGAGTGKTTTLVARIVAWILGAGWEAELAAGSSLGTQSESQEKVATRVLEGLVAMTFTEAAAAEMSTRVGDALAVIEGGEIPRGVDPRALPADPAVRVVRARALLGNVDRLAATTIHAFCRRMLSAHPLELGLDPRFEIDADGKTSATIVRSILEDHLVTAYGESGEDHLLELAKQGFGPREIETALLRFVDTGASADLLEPDPFRTVEVRSLLSRVEESAQSLLSIVEPRLGSAKRLRSAKKIIDALHELSSSLQLHGGEGLPALERAQSEIERVFPPNLRGHLAKWARRSSSLSGTELELTESIADELSNRSEMVLTRLSHLQSLNPELLDHSRKALLPLVSSIRSEMRRRGCQTFSALLSDARTLLRDHEQAREKLRGQIKQMLVDEFQDTDLIQCEIIRHLALEGPEESRPGLFLVGDPKQSIFGWRSADLRAYDRFVDEVVGRGGEVHSLTVNFRSAPAILREVQTVVSPIMEKRTGVQPMFQTLIPSEVTRDSPGFDDHEWRPVEYWAIADWNPDLEEINPHPTSNRITEIESRALAHDIRLIHDTAGVEWADIAILFRAATETEPYLGALRDFGIPYFVERDTNFYRRREIIDVCALVRTILDPNDHLALVTFLRSASVGVPDAAWIPLWNRKFPQRMSELTYPRRRDLTTLQTLVREAVDATPKEIPGLERIEGWENNLLHAIERIAGLRQDFEELASDEFVEHLRRSLLVEATESARYLGQYRLANLDRFFRNLEETLEESLGDHQVVLRSLRSGVAQAREAEEGRPNDAALNAVQVMTIHKAKGLDFDHVYLLQTHRTRYAPDSHATMAPEPGADAASSSQYKLFGFATAGFDEVLLREKEVEAAERVRTLYVAMTRAKKRLVVCGLWLKDVGEIRPGRAQNHMELVFASDRVPEEARAAMRRKERTADLRGVRWVFPGLVSNSTPENFFDEDDALPRVEEVRRASRRLASERTKADARMARPSRGVASAEAHHELDMFLAERSRSLETAPTDSDGARIVGPRAGPRSLARQVGTFIHKIFETVDLEKDLGSALKEARQRAATPLLAGLTDDESAALTREVDSLLARFEAGDLFHRFDEIRGRVVARELPVLLPPTDDLGGPVGATTGAVDLVVRDGESGELTVIDFKTDETATDAEITARANAYSSQLRVYARALMDATGLDRAPRCELWFLRSDRIVPFDPEVFVGPPDSLNL